MKNIGNFLFILFAIVFQSFGGIFGKYAALTLSALTPVGIITNPFYILTLTCFFLQAIMWQQALVRYPLSFAYPFMSLVNFVVLFLSAFLFGEGITIGNFIGLVLISIGITIILHKHEVPET